MAISSALSRGLGWSACVLANARIKVTFVDSKGKEIKTVEGSEGDNLLSLAHEYDVDLEGEWAVEAGVTGVLDSGLGYLLLKWRSVWPVQPAAPAPAVKPSRVPLVSARL